MKAVRAYLRSPAGIIGALNVAANLAIHDAAVRDRLAQVVAQVRPACFSVIAEIAAGIVATVVLALLTDALLVLLGRAVMPWTRRREVRGS